MKITFSKILLAGGMLLSLNSCREEVFSQEQVENKISLADASVKNGRLYFPSKESLKAKYEELKGVSDNEIINYLDNKNFESLRPIITDKNETQVIEIIKERKNNLYKNRGTANKVDTQNPPTVEDVLTDLDDLEEIIGDDAYSAMLNGEAEIQVANIIYKYTDVGLFISTTEDYGVLINYLNTQNICPNLLEPTDAVVVQEYIANMPSATLVEVIPIMYI